MKVYNYNSLEELFTREISKQSYYEFYKEAFCQLHPDTDYDENWHARYMCEVLEQEFWRIYNKETRKKDLIFNIPFRSSKSLICKVTQ